jgi:1-acyl-sn-glycerol-3-phosphate acyltransferase
LLVPVIGLTTAILGLVSLLASLVDREGKIQHGCARLWARLILIYSGVRIESSGWPVSGAGPYVFVANHQSFYDIPILLVTLPLQFRILAKEELFRIPVMGWAMRRAGYLPISRQRAAGANILRRAGELMRAGASVVFFPEGRRNHGQVQPFKAGGFLLAQRAAAPVVPVTILGARRVLPHGSMRVRGGTVSVVLDPPLLPSEAGRSGAEELRRCAESLIRRRHTEAFPQGENLD